jgi:YidC/Oxa1 family membrane protein insertase
MWDTVVELVRAGIVTLANVGVGSLGHAIIAVSFGVRLALLPLTLKMARHAKRQQERLRAIQPALKALQAQYAKDPQRLMQQTQALYAAHDIKLFTPAGFASLLIQAPVFSALFAALRTGVGERVRFAWVADLARPDALLAVLVALGTGLITAGVSATGGSDVSRTMVTVMASLVTVLTLVFLWSASSAVALSVGAGSLTSLVQQAILVREDRVARGRVR